MTIGVLALQGDVREHAAALSSLGETVRPVLGPSDLDGLRGLVLPGGESTTLSLLLASSGLDEPLAEALRGGLAVLGTCAGMILLSGEVLDGRPDQWSCPMIDLTVRRNGYGRQQASFECDLDVAGLGPGPLHAVFIRAPLVERAGAAVTVLAELSEGAAGPEAADTDGATGPSGGRAAARPVACRQGRALVTAFHPELTGDRRLHQLFVEMTKEETG